MPIGVNLIMGQAIKAIASGLLNSGSCLLNSGSCLLNSGSRLLNSDSRLLNSGSRLLNSDSRLLNSDSRLLNSGSHLLNSGSCLLNSGQLRDKSTLAPANEICRLVFQRLFLQRVEREFLLDFPLPPTLYNPFP
jgi:hypothetical protein